MNNQTVLVLDFGGQYKQLIARRVRECNVYSVIHNGNIDVDKVKEINPIGIIMTGGPNSVYKDDSPKCNAELFNLGIPILGICYGMQLMCHTLGGVAEPCPAGQYGKINVVLDTDSFMFHNLPVNETVLMSHTDQISKLPSDFVNTGRSGTCENIAVENPVKKLYGLQFHPEVQQTDYGLQMIRNFLFKICGALGDFTMDDYIERQVDAIRTTIAKEKVVLGLSGGVDSSVCAALLSKAVPGQLICIFVDHGFMRLNEGDEIERIFSKKNLNFIRVNAQERFLIRLKGITDPEQKREIIGEEFVRVFEQQAAGLGNIKYLAQGTIYPDVIESGGEMGAVIKSHHNVGGLPSDLSFEQIIEPLSGLFKDEVRVVGKKLGLPKFLVERQPFPGPGLAIRIMGEVTKQKLEILRHADGIFCEEIAKLRNKPQQYFAVLPDVKSVGVKGDSRTYDYVIAVRAVTTKDFMTCEYTALPHRVLSRVCSRIVNEVKDVSRVVYDITGKPPATVEWE